MKVRYLKDHFENKAGDISNNKLTAERLNYLLRVGAVEMINENDYSEKEEIAPAKEKKEHKGLPTAKKKK